MCVPSGYKAPSRFAPAGRGSTMSSRMPHGWTWKWRFPVTEFFHSYQSGDLSAITHSFFDQLVAYHGGCLDLGFFPIGELRRGDLETFILDP